MTAFEGRFTTFVRRARAAPLAGQPILLALVLACSIFLLTLSFVGLYFAFGVRPEPLLRDPNSTARQPEYFGVVSYVGALVWAAAAAVSMFGGLLLHRQGRRAGRAARYARMLLAGGILTLLLCADDLFMIHEGLGKRLGVSDIPFLVVYGTAALAWLFLSAPLLLQTEWLLLGLALAAFGGSVFVDLGLIDLPAQMLFEDMLKLFGILCWAAYFLRLTWRLLR